MPEYMLITSHPLCSSKSFHKTYEALEEKLLDIFKMTEDYYILRNEVFEYEEHLISGHYPGIYVYKIWPENVHSMMLVGRPKPMKHPELLRKLNELDTSE